MAIIRFASNETASNQTGWMSVKQETRVELTELRRDQNYTKYYTFLTRLVITGIFPILALLFFNINIYLVSCKQSRKGIWNYYIKRKYF